MDDITQHGKPTGRVLASGVFDILHPGHLYYLTAAAAYGDRLVVVVTSDGHATRTKRPPRHPAADRVAMLRALSVVDEAFVGPDPYDLAATIRRARPDVIALGHDQPFEPDGLRDEVRALGKEVRVVRIKRLDGAAASRDVEASRP